MRKTTAGQLPMGKKKHNPSPSSPQKSSSGAPASTETVCLEPAASTPVSPAIVSHTKEGNSSLKVGALIGAVLIAIVAVLLYSSGVSSEQQGRISLLQQQLADLREENQRLFQQQQQQQQQEQKQQLDTEVDALGSITPPTELNFDSCFEENGVDLYQMEKSPRYVLFESPDLLKCLEKVVKENPGEVPEDAISLLVPQTYALDMADLAYLEKPSTRPVWDLLTSIAVLPGVDPYALTGSNTSLCGLAAMVEKLDVIEALESAGIYCEDTVFVDLPDGRVFCTSIAKLIIELGQTEVGSRVLTLLRGGVAEQGADPVHLQNLKKHVDSAVWISDWHSAGLPYPPAIPEKAERAIVNDFMNNFLRLMLNHTGFMARPGSSYSTSRTSTSVKGTSTTTVVTTTVTRVPRQGDMCHEEDSLLYRAAATGNTEATRLLVDHYKSVFNFDSDPTSSQLWKMLTFTDPAGRSAVHIARMSGFEDLAELLTSLEPSLADSVDSDTVGGRVPAALSPAVIAKEAAAADSSGHYLAWQHRAHVVVPASEDDFGSDLLDSSEDTMLPKDGGWASSGALQLELPPSRCDVVEVGLEDTADLPSSQLSQQLLHMRRHVYARHFPTVLRGAAANTHTQTHFAKDDVLKRYGHLKVPVEEVPGGFEQFGHKQPSVTTLREFVSSSSDSVPMHLSASLQALKQLNPKSSLGSDFPAPPSVLGVPETRGKPTVPSSVKLQFGAPWSGFPPRPGASSAHVLAYGLRRWFFWPPGDASRAATMSEPIKKLLHKQSSWLSDQEQDDEKHCEPGVSAEICEIQNFQTSPPLSCMQRSGDVVFVPRGWFHAAVNVNFSVGYSFDFSQDPISLMPAAEEPK
mmetsp:Transcript_26763/g.52745  ORF Transcript_26763/g.52745 Transcript_26763/m.52745 type:complete len:859 (+) Transcript_26763:102-2678(+)|eukprot:CAMPEP_0175133914 /NCGR_PEP_ID=MMETSP0087-20121206/7898_1 /TAXON_ID=136419 /ORGANISM="Unknown Unknown, Strain D1" /LENGTH=858 /DNA_ID=CAMNT_0016416439 /DNA_START=1279 /DNA_END=3855 /DNA_ORIENTATION=-